MSVKVIKNRVFDGKKTYEIGDVIEGLSKKDEFQLVSEGIAEYTTAAQRSQGSNSNETLEEVGTKDDNIDGKEGAGEVDSGPTIDPNSLALNTDEYVSAKGK